MDHVFFGIGYLDALNMDHLYAYVANSLYVKQYLPFYCRLNRY